MTRLARAALALPALGLLPMLGACGWAEELRPQDPARVAEVRLAYVPGVSSIYCYSTLGRPDCYATPQPGPPNRLIGGIE